MSVSNVAHSAHAAPLTGAQRETQTSTAVARSRPVAIERELLNESQQLNILRQDPQGVIEWDPELGLPRPDEADDVALMHPAPAGGAMGASGPGGCCNHWEAGRQMVKAGVVQGMATAAVFGTKPLVEATVLQALGITSLTAVTPAAAMIAGVAGGVYAGATHTLIGKVVSGVMNTLLQVDTYALRRGHSEVGYEVATIDLPVLASFVAGYAARGAAMQGNTDIWVDALSKTITSTVAGVVQGVITDALRQAMSEVYDNKPPTELSGSKWDLFVRTFESTLKSEFKDGRTIGHDFVGKIVGSVVGMLGTTAMRDVRMTPTERGAAGMTVYLGSWFAGIHSGAEIGDMVGRSSSSTSPQRTVVDIESAQTSVRTSSLPS